MRATPGYVFESRRSRQMWRKVSLYDFPAIGSTSIGVSGVFKASLSIGIEHIRNRIAAGQSTAILPVPKQVIDPLTMGRVIASPKADPMVPAPCPMPEIFPKVFSSEI